MTNMSATPKHYLQVLKARQWVKNGLLLVPSFFDGTLSGWDTWSKLLSGVVAFCLCASAVYIFNDLRDIKWDKQHPKKKLRPIASGAISPTNARIFMMALLIAALGFGYYLEPKFAGILLVYFGMNVLYSIKLKEIAYLDVSIIAFGFLLRLWAGGELVGVTPTLWLLSLAFLLMLFLGLAKRRDELLRIKNGQALTRKSLQQYKLPTVDGAMIAISVGIMVVYTFYAFSPEVITRLGSSLVFLTGIPVAAGLVRYFHLTRIKQKAGDPAALVMKDIVLQLILVCWFGAFAYFIYWNV